MKCLIIMLQVLTPSGHLHFVGLCEKYRKYLKNIKPGNYVLIEGIPGTKNTEIIRKLNTYDITQYVHDQVWPPRFDPNVTQISLNERNASKKRLERFKGLHSASKYCITERCRQPLILSSENDSDAVPEGECESWPPRSLISNHNKKCVPWVPHSKKLKILNQLRTDVYYLKQIQAKELRRDLIKETKMRLKADKMEAKAKKQEKKKIKAQRRLEKKKDAKLPEKEREEKQKVRKEARMKEKKEEKAEREEAKKKKAEKRKAKKEEAKKEKAAKENADKEKSEDSSQNLNENNFVSSKFEDDKPSKSDGSTGGDEATTSKTGNKIKHGKKNSQSKIKLMQCTPWPLIVGKKYNKRKVTQRKIDKYIKFSVARAKKKQVQIKKARLRKEILSGENYDSSSSKESDSESSPASTASSTANTGSDSSGNTHKKKKAKKTKEIIPRECR